MALSVTGWKISEYGSKYRAVDVGFPYGLISHDTPVRFRSALPNKDANARRRIKIKKN